MVRVMQRLERQLLVVLALAAMSTGAGAQRPARVIDGVVVDTRDRPVPFASLVVVGGPTTTSDDSGHFRLVVAHADRLVFDIKRIGYIPSRIALADGGDTTVSVLPLPAATTLPGVEVKDAPIRPPGLAGFEARMLERKRGTGSGYFFTAKEIEDMHPTRSTQVVENTPSMVVRRTTGDRFAIYAKAVNGGECPATIYLDGVRIGGSGDVMTAKDRRGRTVVIRGAEGDGSSIDQFVEPTDLAGVEVYPRGMFAPILLQPNDPQAKKCAIVAYWTKHAS